MRAPSAIPDAPRPVIPPQWSMSQRHGRQICPRRAHTAAWAQRPISDDWVLVTKSICPIVRITRPAVQPTQSRSRNAQRRHDSACFIAAARSHISIRRYQM